MYWVDYGSLWNNSAASTTIPWGNEPFRASDVIEVKAVPVPPALFRSKRTDKLFLRAVRQYEERAKARLLMVAPLELVTCSSPRTPACTVARPPRTRERVSFRNSVLERQALPRNES